VGDRVFSGFTHVLDTQAGIEYPIEQIAERQVAHAHLPADTGDEMRWCNKDPERRTQFLRLGGSSGRVRAV
jgi:hypothetical protein